MKKNKNARKNDTNNVALERPVPVPSAEASAKESTRAEIVRGACAKIGSLFTQEEVNVALSRYDIGAEVNELRAAETTHGSGLVADVAKVLGRDEDTLYDYGSVAALVGRKQFQELAHRLNTANVPLSFSHFIELATKNGKRGNGLRADQWMPLFERALNENLSVRALGKLVREALKGTSRGNAKKPSPLLQLMRVTGRFASYTSKVEPFMAELEREGRTANNTEPLALTIQQVEHVYSECARVLERLRTIQGNDQVILAAAE